MESSVRVDVMTNDLPTEQARIQALVEQGQALVVSLASRIRGNIPVRVDMEDLIAYGEIGLAEAAHKFDPTRGTAFTTFAYPRVRGAIYDGVAKMSWTGRGKHRRLRFRHMAKEYLDSQPNESTDQDASTLEKDAQWFRDTTDRLAVIFFSSRDDGQGDNFGSTIEDQGTPAASFIVAQREIIGKLHDLVDALPSTEEKLIRRVYFEGKTLQEAGNSLRITKSWASRLHAQALERLARMLRRLGAND